MQKGIFFIYSKILRFVLDFFSKTKMVVLFILPLARVSTVFYICHILEIAFLP
jgi:hypothetical protein